MDEASTELAHHLVALGAGPDVIIGLLMERCPQIYVAMLGIMKAGAAHVPLDPAYPPERLAFMLEDTAAPILVTHRGFEGRLDSTAAVKVWLASGHLTNLCCACLNHHNGHVAVGLVAPRFCMRREAHPVLSEVCTRVC